MLIIATMTTQDHLTKLRCCQYPREREDYLLALYEAEGAKLMLEVLRFYDMSERSTKGLLLYTELVRRIVEYEGVGGALETLESFEEVLVAMDKESLLHQGGER